MCVRIIVHNCSDNFSSYPQIMIIAQSVLEGRETFCVRSPGWSGVAKCFDALVSLTSSSCIVEGPHDALSQLKSCQLLYNCVNKKASIR